MWRLSTKWRVVVDRAVAPLGLAFARYSPVASLYGMRRAGERPSRRRLADHTGPEPLYVSKLAQGPGVRRPDRADPGPRDPRTVQLALTERGEDVTRRATIVVHGLLEWFPAPLGGPDSERTRAFTGELATLLDVPPDPAGISPEAES